MRYVRKGEISLVLGILASRGESDPTHQDIEPTVTKCYVCAKTLSVRRTIAIQAYDVSRGLVPSLFVSRSY